MAPSLRLVGTSGKCVRSHFVRGWFVIYLDFEDNEEGCWAVGIDSDCNSAKMAIGSLYLFSSLCLIKHFTHDI